MAYRGSESAMDFQYDNDTGRVDAQSPFVRYANDNKLRGSASAKRDFSALNSSSQFPALRDPASSHSFLFSQPPASPERPLSALPPHMNISSPAFQTPQKPKINFDSSDAESSPDNCNADNEASPASPAKDNMGLRSTLAKTASRAVTKFVGNDPDSENQNIFTSTPKGTPGRGEIQNRSSGAYSRRVEKRVQNRSSKRLGMFTRKGSSSSDTDGAQDRKKGKHKYKDETPGGLGLSISAFFKFLHEHPNLPHILSFYAQLALNIFFVSIIMYTVWAFWVAIQTDVHEKASQVASGIMALMAVCAEDFRKNRCDARDRAPALDSPCNEWKQCMEQDPMIVGRAKVTAGTFAEIVNSFVEPITWKAFSFATILFTVAVVASNFGFSVIRNRTAGHHPAAPYMNAGPGYYEQPPSTPRHLQNGMYPPEGYYSAYQSRDPSPSKMQPAQQLGMSSPTRQLQYNYH